MSLSSFISLHNLMGKNPITSNGDLEGDILCTNENIQLLKDCKNSEHCRLDEICIDNVEIDLDDLSPSDKMLSISITVKTSGNSLIFKSIDDMLNRRKTLSQGMKIDEFYLFGDDKDTQLNTDKIIAKLNSICDLINGLSELAHYHDNKAVSDRHSFVFVNESDISKGHPLVIETSITKNMLDVDPIDITLIHELCSSSVEAQNPNIGRERSVFRATLIEYLKNKSLHAGDEFSFLILGWSDFLKLFQRNFDTYISGFAFHKARKDVADAELSIADQLSKIIGEIGGKVLGIPLSLAVLIPIVNSKSMLESLILCLGLLLASIISSAIIYNQQRQLSRVVHAKGIMFSGIQGESSPYPKDLRDLISSASDSLDDNEQNLKKILWFLRIISWAPTLMGVAIFFNYYEKHFQISILSAIFIFSLFLFFIFRSNKKHL